MAFDQSKLFTNLEGLIDNLNRDEFIYDFLLAFGSPKATITKLKKSFGSAGTVLDSGVILKNKVLFQTCPAGQKLHEMCSSLKEKPHIVKDKIRFVIVTDFEDLVAYDTKAKDTLDVEFIELPKSYAFFLPLAGIEKFEVTSEHPADVKASYKMGQLCDVIRRHNDINTQERVHALNVFLTRLLFCFYAEDTGIFSDNQMVKTIQNTTNKDGKDLKPFFESFFKVLNFSEGSIERASLPSHFTDFPYVNGGLFAKEEWIPEFTDKARRMIIEIGALEWDQINPDIFGSMFQAVIDPEQRGSLGQHYTSVPNIMKVITPLFLDDLEKELNNAKNSVRKLQCLLLRLQRIRIFDPACGSGNFLIIAYKELRKFEIKVFKALNTLGEQSVMFMSGIRLSQFYGIEIDDFAHEIALLSLWLAENQMNKAFEDEFGVNEPSLPLKASGNIHQANSLKIDWSVVCPKSDLHTDDEIYLCGNPPFLGYNSRSKEQQDDMESIFGEGKSFKKLDYVSSWFLLAAQYIGNSKSISSAFVATNSICQGMQVPFLWPRIFECGVHIQFAFTTFSWNNSAKNKAAVHVIVVGLSNSNKERAIYNLDGDKWVKQVVKNINAYLVDGPNSIVVNTSKPLSAPVQMVYGSMPNDGGNLLLSDQAAKDLIKVNPNTEAWVKPILGAQEFLNGKTRFCLWLKDITQEQLAELPEISERVDAVRATRLASKSSGANEAASTPHLFWFESHPEKGNYLLVPKVSSERRRYIPVGFFDHNTVSSDANLIIPNANLFHFAIVTSEMHNDWMRMVAGRLKSDYRYSASLVFNTFPWPSASRSQVKEIETLAEEVLLVREDHVEKTLAEMYDPNKMPEDLKEAHHALDSAVEKLYRSRGFQSQEDRLSFLFNKYEELVSRERCGA